MHNLYCNYLKVLIECIFLLAIEIELLSILEMNFMIINDSIICKQM